MYLLLYLIATFYYPGGSSYDPKSTGFSWAHNFWCNLLNEPALNGESNSARPIAIVAMCVLAISLSLFWIIFARFAIKNYWIKGIVLSSGILSMLASLLLFSRIDHDLVTNMASALGCIATVGVLATLYKIKWKGLFAFGIINLLLVLLNTVLYYNKDWILFLPLVQKISFASFLIWTGCIDLQLLHLACSDKNEVVLKT